MKTKTTKRHKRPAANRHESRNNPDPQPTLVCLVLDRSGSMASCKAETIQGFNSYVGELKKHYTVGSRFHFVQFDTGGIDTVQDMVLMNEAALLNEESYQPRAFTPLNDAVGRTIRQVEDRAKRFRFKVVFVVQTDGKENSSKEFTTESVKALMKQMENDHKWTFAFIGTGPEGWDAMQQFSYGTQSASNVMHTTGALMVKAMRAAAMGTVSYMCSVTSGDTVKKDFYNGQEDQTK